jgi:hypothetical protein
MTGQAKNVIHVPKPPPSAFNKERAASQLLLDQMIHSARALAEHLRTLDNRATNTPVTEEQAGDFVRLATSILHPHTSPSPGKKKSRANAKKKKGKGRG